MSPASLLNAMGQAEAQDLGLDGGPLYDPLGNYRRVANNWNDWASDPRHVQSRPARSAPQELPANPIVTPQIDSARITIPLLRLRRQSGGADRAGLDHDACAVDLA